MKEFGRRFAKNLNQGIRRIRINWFGVGLIGGSILALSGTEGFVSGASKFNAEVKGCEKVITQLDPPVYSLRTPTEICADLDRGVSSREIIAKFEEKAQQERPMNIVKFIGGTGLVLGTLAYGFGPILLNARRRTSESESSEPLHSD